MFLLDTNILSELRRPQRVPPAVLDWAASVTDEQCYLSVITIWELDQGALGIGQRDARQGAVLRDWIDASVLPRYRERLLPVDLPVARACARLHVPDRRPERDSLIAATAIVHGLTVVTRDADDFAAMDVSIFNPWELI